MKIKIALSWFVAMSILLSTAVISGQPAGTIKTDIVVLVSNNIADKTAAEVFAEIKGAKLVVTNWGTLNESAVKEIIISKPKTVYIIGGPVAIPNVTETILANVVVIRLWGPTRYETAAAIAENGWRSANTVVLVNGDDEFGMDEIKVHAKIARIPVLYIKVNDVPDKVKIVIEKLGTTNVTLIVPPGLDKEKVKVKIKAKLNEIETKLEGRAEKAITEAEEAISEAKAKLAEAKAQNINLTATAAETLIDTADKHLTDAKKAFNETKYGSAFGLAVAARHNAENAERILENSLEAEEKEEVEVGKNVSATKHILIAAKIISKVAEKIQEAKNKSINVSVELQILANASAKLADAENALAAGNLEQAKTLAKEAMKLAIQAKQSLMIKLGLSKIEFEREEWKEFAEKIFKEMPKRMGRD